MKQVSALVISNSEIVPGTHLIWLESQQIASASIPGQFVMVRCGEGSEFPLRRPLSIHQRAPLYLLAQETLNQDCSVTLLLGASTATQLYPGHLLSPEVELVITTGDGSKGKKGVITDLLPDFIDRADQIFACGPMPMYGDMYQQRETLLKAKPVQVSLEVRMGCGLGVCYGCTVRTKSGLKQVCQDGPVFELTDILWDELAYND